MLYLRPRSIQHPPKQQLNILNHMARNLNMPHIRRMILRADIIMLHYPRRIEVVNERLQILVFAAGGGLGGVGYGVVDDRGGEVFGGVEVLVDAVDLGVIAGALLVGVANGAEAFPE
jgi:hypothetical protein